MTVEASDEQSKTARLVVTVTVTNLTDARAAIRGTAQVGRTLTAQTSGIADKGRRDIVGRRSMTDFSYQWLADDKDIEGAMDSTYEITEEDEGKTIKVRITYTDYAGNEKTLTSAATAPVKPAQSNVPAMGLPTHQWHGAGGRDADSGYVGYIRCRRYDRRRVQIPVDTAGQPHG